MTDHRTESTAAAPRAPLPGDQDSAAPKTRTPRQPRYAGTWTETPTPGLTPYDRIESLLVGIGAKPGRVVGKITRTGLGLELTVWILPGGAPVIVQRFRDGGVDVYVQASEDNTITSVEEAILARSAPEPDA